MVVSTMACVMTCSVWGTTASSPAARLRYETTASSTEQKWEGQDVAREHGERCAAAAVDGGAAAAGVGGDDPEVLRQRGHVGDVSDGAVGPARSGRGEAAVEQHERGTVAGLDVGDLGRGLARSALRVRPGLHRRSWWAPFSGSTGSCAEACGRGMRRSPHLRHEPVGKPSSGSRPCCMANRPAAARLLAPILL